MYFDQYYSCLNLPFKLLLFREILLPVALWKICIRLIIVRHILASKILLFLLMPCGST